MKFKFSLRRILLFTSLHSLLIALPLPLFAMANQGNSNLNPPKDSSSTTQTPKPKDELEAARAFIRAKERLLQLQNKPNPFQKEIQEAQENLRRARIALQTALLHETTQDLTQNLERTGERAKELLEKTTQESASLLQNLIQELEKIIPSDKTDSP
jgi:predicted  nucleic acid-binding Zn-ribbon protein